MNITKLGLIAAGMSVALIGCASDGKDGTDGTDGSDGSNGSNGSNGAAGSPGAQGDPGATGPAGPAEAQPALYTLSNAADGNQVSAWLRAEDGNLSRNGTYATTGKGLGAGIGSQGALAWDAASQRFFAVNPGDNTISMLAIDDTTGELTMLSTVPSGGTKPVSIAVHAGVVYVLNYGDINAANVGANITGFKVAGNALTAIASSTQPLSGSTDVHPTDLRFSPDGAYVLAVERIAGKLDTFKLVNGVAQAGTFQASQGMQPFAFDWSPEGFLVVAEVGDGSATGSSASSYSIGADGTLTPITSKLPTLQAAACWIAVAGGYAYLANAASANITAITVDPTGALTLHDKTGIAATTGTGAADVAVSPDHGILYSLSAGDHAIHPFAIHPDGSLTAMPVLANLPAAAAGLAVR